MGWGLAGFVVPPLLRSGWVGGGVARGCAPGNGRAPRWGDGVVRPAGAMGSCGPLGRWGRAPVRGGGVVGAAGTARSWACWRGGVVGAAGEVGSGDIE